MPSHVYHFIGSPLIKTPNTFFSLL